MAFGLRESDAFSKPIPSWIFLETLGGKHTLKPHVSGSTATHFGSLLSQTRLTSLNPLVHHFPTIQGQLGDPSPIFRQSIKSLVVLIPLLYHVISHSTPMIVGWIPFVSCLNPRKIWEKLKNHGNCCALMLHRGLLHVSLKSLSKNAFTSPACDGLPPNKLATAEKRLAASSALGVQFTPQTLSEVDGGWFLAGVEKPPYNIHWYTTHFLVSHWGVNIFDPYPVYLNPSVSKSKQMLSLDVHPLQM